MGDVMEIAFVVLLLLGWLIALPIFLLMRVANLTRSVQDLQDQLARLERVAEPAAKPPDQARREALERIARPAPPPPAEAPRVAIAAPAPPPMPAAPPPTPVTPTPVTLPPVPPPPRPAPAWTAPDWESLLGANWLAKLGVAALVLAAGFFLKYAFDSGMIGDTAKVWIILIAAGILIGIGQHLLPSERYRTYAQVLMSGGIVLYFLAVYMAFAGYGIIGFPTAFAALALGAIAASAVATANNTEAVALLCLLGAFITPVLLQEEGGTGPAKLAQLYFYLTGLNVWAAVLVKYRRWFSLTALSFGATWIIFFGSGPGHQPNFLLLEFFALAFLLFACHSALSTLSRKAEVSAETSRLLVLMIVTACVAFAAISAVILGGSFLLDVPALAVAGLVLAFVLIGLSVALPELPASDRSVRQLFLYLSCASLVLLMAFPVATAWRLTPAQAPVCFAFTVVSYLIFLIVAVMVQRQQGYEGPAAVLVAANALGHVMATLHVLYPIRLWSVHAGPAWLPVAGWITLMFVWLPAVQREAAATFRKALLITPQALTILALPAALYYSYQWRPYAGLAIFWSEFVVISLTWLAARRYAGFPGLRADLLAAFVNAAAFFGLMAVAAGMREYQGLVILCGCALALAVYHALIGVFVLTRPGDDVLHRLTYLGLAVTFVTIAIPLQLRQSYLTVAWAVESIVLIYSGLAVKDARVRLYGLVLLLVAAAKAFFLDLPPLAEPVRLLHNPRLLSGGSIIVAAGLCAALLARSRRLLAESEAAISSALTLLASLFALVFLSTALWQHLAAVLPYEGRGSAQQLALSIFWSLYALALMAVGIWRRAKPVRLFALALLFLSIIKVFLFDLSFLQQPYRIFSFFGLGLILLVVSLLYTRFEERLK
jgi:uncharacterized membrane protein